MRKLMFALFLSAACGKNTASQECSAGQVYAGGECRILCDDTCPPGYDCDTNRGYCVAAGRKPEITSITGDGDPNSTAGEAANYIRYALVIDGVNLENATNVALAGTGGLPTFPSLAIRSNTPTRIEVDLPAMDPVNDAGTYVLSVTNALGTAQASFPVMRGEQGDAGTCDPSACSMQTYPGAQLVTAFNLRGVNPSGGAVEQSFALDGSERITVPADGVYFGVLDRATQQPVTTDPDYNRNYDVSNSTELNILALELDSIAANRVVVLASRGDVSAAMNQVVSSLTLAGEMMDLGAGPAAQSVGAGDAFVFVGAPGIGQGNAAFVLSSTGVADALVRLVDGIVVGRSTGDFFGRSIDSSEITDGTIATADIGNGQVTGAKIAIGVAGSGLAHSGSQLYLDTGYLGDFGCYLTGYVNSMDGVMDYQCPANHYMRGMYSYHSNGTEDRQFRFYCCKLFP